jgi:hypothetical protein
MSRTATCGLVCGVGGFMIAAPPTTHRLEAGVF